MSELSTKEAVVFAMKQFDGEQLSLMVVRENVIPCFEPVRAGIVVIIPPEMEREVLENTDWADHKHAFAHKVHIRVKKEA